MKSYIVVCDSRHERIADELAKALAAERGVLVGVMGLQEFRAKELAIYGHRFIIFIGRNAVSRSYIEEMEVHDLGCGIRWGVNTHLTAAVWLGTGHQISLKTLRKALKMESREPALPNTAVDAYQKQNIRGLTPLLRQTIVAPFSRTVRDSLAYTVGVFEFLEHVIDPPKSHERRLALAS